MREVIDGIWREEWLAAKRFPRVGVRSLYRRYQRHRYSVWLGSFIIGKRHTLIPAMVLLRRLFPCCKQPVVSPDQWGRAAMAARFIGSRRHL